MEKIRIKYFTDQIEKLDYIEGKSDGIDMRASEEVSLHAGEFALIPLGVAMELPKGYEAHLVPRSSTFKTWGIPVYATRDTVIHSNDRIAQFRIMNNKAEISFEQVEHLGNDSRGGFGSTGKA